MESDPLDQALDRLRSVFQRTISRESSAPPLVSPPHKQDRDLIELSYTPGGETRTRTSATLRLPIAPAINIDGKITAPRSAAKWEPSREPVENQVSRSILSRVVAWFRLR
jgi:hypothetical protein